MNLTESLVMLQIYPSFYSSIFSSVPIFNHRGILGFDALLVLRFLGMASQKIAYTVYVYLVIRL